jgi:hypothetical protein
VVEHSGGEGREIQQWSEEIGNWSSGVEHGAAKVEFNPHQQL